MSHFKKVCQDCEAILVQCRCPGPKDIERVPCPKVDVARCKKEQKVNGVEVDTPKMFLENQTP